MKQTNVYQAVATALLLAISVSSCAPDYNEGQIAIDKYCELNLIEHNAPAGPQKDAAAATKNAFVKEVDDKYFKDNKMYQFILDGMKQCDERIKK
ncbi:MAG: hypothetical protein QM731_24280 [Chitinophagaceae bacterium]